MANELQTYGDIKQVIASITKKQKVAKLKSTGGDFALGAALSVLPGGEAIKTGLDFIKAGFSRPDTKKTNTWIDKLDVDDEVSRIVDDTVENQFIQYIANRILREPDDKALEDDFNMNALLVDFIRDNFEGRTVTGIKENIKMKKIQEDKISALLDRLPTSVKRAFMSKTEKQKDIDMTDARDAYYDLPKRMRAKVDALIDPDTGRVRAGANSEELGESLASNINKAGYKTWKYTDPSGEVFFAYGKDEDQAKQYLVLKSMVNRSLEGKFDNIDTSKIEFVRDGVGMADKYIQAIYKKTTDTLEPQELPLFTTENKNKMKVNQLKQIIREEISKALNEADSSVMGGIAKNLYLYLKGKKPNHPLDINGAQLRNVKGEPMSYDTKVSMNYQNAAVGMDQMARQGRAASLGKGSQYSEVSLFFHGNLLSALGFVKKEEAEEALKYIMDKYPNQLEHLYGGEPRVVESKMDYDWAKNYAPKYQFYVILKDDKARAKSQSAKPQTKELNENKMKVNQLRQIIREEISKVLKEGKRYSSFEEWKEKVINNPKLKNLSDEELRDRYEMEKDDYESMRRELPDEF